MTSEDHAPNDLSIPYGGFFSTLLGLRDASGRPNICGKRFGIFDANGTALTSKPNFEGQTVQSVLTLEEHNMDMWRLDRFSLLLALLVFLSAHMASANSNVGITGEATNSYFPCSLWPDLKYAISEVEQFESGMTTTGGISWTMLNGGVWEDGNAWSQDLWDSDVVSGADDNTAFDPPNGAISIFSGHGICQDKPNSGTTITNCTTGSQCTGPGTGQTGPGVCTKGPNKTTGTCLYRAPREAVFCSPSGDLYGPFTNISDGNTKLGESSVSGAWAGAGTNGNINFAILDISCGVRPGLEVQGLFNAFAGVSNIATIMPTTWDSDTADVADRGPAFAALFRANPNGSIAVAWVNTLTHSSGGSACNGTTSGYHGIGGCGANWVGSVAQTESYAEFLNGTESWAQAQDDGYDPTSAGYMAWLYVCNYDCSTYPINI